MAGLTLPTTLGAATIPQTPYIRRAATINTNIGDQAALEAQNIREQGQDKIPPALNNVGDSFDKLQLQADQKEAKDSINKLSAENRLLLYGDGTPNNPGYYGLQGDNAVKAAPTIKAQIENNRQKYLALATNKQTATMYDVASQAMIQPDLDGVLKHGVEQHSVAMDATDAASVDTGVNNLAANPTNDQNVANSTTLIRSSVMAQLARQGITDPTAIDDKVKAKLSEGYAAAIRVQLVRDPKTGAELYAKWKKNIIGVDQDNIEQGIVAAEDRQMRKQEHAVYMQQAQQSRDSEAGETEWSRKIMLHSADPNKYPDPSLDDIALDPRLKSSSLQTLNAMLTSADKGDALPKVSARTFSGILPRIFLPAGDPNKISTYAEINQAVANHTLSKADWGTAASLIDQGRSEDGQKLSPKISAALQAATQVIAHPAANGIIADDNAAIKLQQWTNDMNDKVAQYKQENKDPSSLFDRKSKDYLLSPQNIQPYLLPLDQRMKDFQSSLNGGAPDETQFVPDQQTGEQQEEATAPKSIKIEDAHDLPYPIFQSPDNPDFDKMPNNSPFYRPDGQGNLVLRYKQPKKPTSAARAAPSGM